MTLVIFGRGHAVGFGRNAAVQSKLLEQLPELVRIVGFVGENRSGAQALDQIRGGDDIVDIPRRKDHSQRSPAVVDQSVNLGIGPAASFSNLLILSRFSTPEGVLVRLHASRVDRPQLTLSLLGQELEDLFPYTRLTPALPASIDGGVRREYAQRTPTAPFPKTEKQRFEYRLDRNRRPPPTSTDASFVQAVNFFSRSIEAASLR